MAIMTHDWRQIIAARSMASVSRACPHQMALLSSLAQGILFILALDSVTGERLKCHFKGGPSRAKRYAIEGSFWGVKNVTYKIKNFGTVLHPDELYDVFRRAFNVWEEKTQLKFQRIENGDAHIDVVFARGDHGDGEPFDGSGHILAHAFFPRYGGDLHFDDDEHWSSDRRGPGLDLYAVAVHEIGHSLGLKHSDDSLAIMAPYYKQYTGEKLHLQMDDLVALNRLYGPDGAANRKYVPKPTTFSPPSLPNLCRDSNIDAATQVQNGTIYLFQNEYFWDLSKIGERLKGPRRIGDFWGLDGPIDAALSKGGSTYLFARELYTIQRQDGYIVPGYPRQIAKGLIDTPSDIGAVLPFKDRVYMFKQDKFWRFSRFGMIEPGPISRLFPSYVRQIPIRIDAALHVKGHGSYLFEGKRMWKLLPTYPVILPHYPKPILGNIFTC